MSHNWHKQHILLKKQGEVKKLHGTFYLLTEMAQKTFLLPSLQPSILRRGDKQVFMEFPLSVSTLHLLTFK